MSKPKSYELKGSFEWIKKKFVKQEYKSVLAHINSCLDEIAGYEYSFLMTKTSVLFCLDQWKDLTNLFNYLYERYPDDAEILYKLAEFFFGQGKWNSALAMVNKSESLFDPNEHAHFLEGLIETKLSCLMVLGKKSESIRVAKAVLKKYPRFSIIRSNLRHITDNKYRLPKAWIPRNFSQSLSKPILNLVKMNSKG